MAAVLRDHGGRLVPGGQGSREAIAQALPRGARGGSRGWPHEPPRPDRGGGQANQVEASRERGQGPLVVLAPYWSGHPGVYEALLSDLARDHRVVTWDARGTGQSTPAGPYDMETDCSDLAAIVDQAGGDAVVISTADGANRAVRVAASRKDLVAAVVALGTAPFARMHFEGSEGMIASETVVGAFINMLERDYRGALRALLSATNAQMSEPELRERVAFQISYCPQEPAAARVRAWAEDDPTAAARETGERLWTDLGCRPHTSAEGWSRR
ncbi:MAG: alpha/beta hydrolase [Actinobacteria bacterium]|nr:MAG: alpha/beta hydrolase [Actinomycetota bacterium]